MTYDPAIPQGSQPQNQTTTPIRTNFAQANTIFGADHVPYDNGTVADRGEHTQMTINGHRADPTLSSPKSMIYTKSDGATSQILYWDRVDTSNNDLITPISPLAMVKFSGAGAITKQINISGAIGVSGSLYTVNFTNAMPDANYIPIVCARRGVSQPLISVEIANASQVLIRITDAAGATMVPSDVYMVVWGF